MIQLSPDRLQSVLESICRSAPRAATIEEALYARDLVCALSRRCAGQGCLQRSVAVVLFCRSRGSAPNWRTGFSMNPFLAHAWVEVDDAPVGELAVVDDYTVVHRADVRL
ncbi:MAG: lasso peptide biosynthesis B2 protein [Brevibacterium aurantiacum]|nr:lasso peptide biosynthesis B2 protein [Janibacter sp.]MDN5737388.1 lasso peptide biosynthesis B2 protein [Brevibacterium aurantiacum]MDN5773960.1 lasso peptide biosynthesis B2 protein [Brevibacterium aurantiacum]